MYEYMHTDLLDGLPQAWLQVQNEIKGVENDRGKQLALFQNNVMQKLQFLDSVLNSERDDYSGLYQRRGNLYLCYLRMQLLGERLVSTVRRKGGFIAERTKWLSRWFHTPKESVQLRPPPPKTTG